MAEEESAPDQVAEETPKKASIPWIPLILVLLFIPIITLVLVEFVVVPKLRSSLGATPDHGSESAHHVAVEEEEDDHGGGHGGGHGKKEKDSHASASRGTVVTYEDLISNVSGTMGTRFLKVSFQIVSEDPQLSGIVRMRDAQVRDAIISTLSNRTIQELEVVGGRNALRVALISSINGALGLNLVEELYFLDFIIQ